MKKNQLKRLARLEAILGKSDPNEVDMKRWGFKSALMATAAFHVGKLSGGESHATAFARALDMTHGELKNTLSPDYDPPDFWPLVLETVNTMVAARGGRPITENGSPILERPRQDDDRRDGFEVLDELYQEIPDELKKRFKLLPALAYYFKEATSAEENSRAQR
jgi:hypothetical protein